MLSKKIFASVYVAASVLATQASAAPSNQINLKKELARVRSTYAKILEQVKQAQDAGEWDEGYHKLQAFMSHPGRTNLSKQAMCAHLKSISYDELEYVGSIIESDATRVSLKDCRAELMNRITYGVQLKKGAFDLEEDIANIRPVEFEEREIDESRDRFSYEGLGPKEVMLTFDDGPRASTTPHILDALRKAGVKAAFFNLGGNALSNKALVQQLLSEGHVLGSHTYRHTLMMAANIRCGKMNYNQFLSEMISGHIGVFAAANYIDPFFRFPNGDADSDMQRNVKELGLKDFRWNVDSHDWEFSAGKIPDYEARRQKILSTFIKDLQGEGKPQGLRDRGIILFHDIQHQTVDTLPLVLNYLADNGYKVVLLKPVNRQVTPDQNFPLVTQARDYMTQFKVKLSGLVPPTNADGDGIMNPSFKPKADFFEIFPQLTPPVLVPVGPEQCAAEALARKQRK